MIRALSQFNLRHAHPPVRRVLALDAGSRRVKWLVAESDFGRLRVLKEGLLDLQAEGLVAPEELQAQLHGLIAEWGHPPLALVLPQHVSISQVVDLPPAPESEIDKLIADETIKLGGVSESRIVYDFVRTEVSAKGRQQFWVTICQEGEIRERILRLGLQHEDLCDVTTTANALINAYRAANPLAARSILVHLGAQTTVVVILLAGQGAFAASFQMGGDFFTRAIARLLGCSEETAEALKRDRDFLTGTSASAEFFAAVDGWVAELKRQLGEWFHQNPGLISSDVPFELIASGGGFDQPGLLGYIRNQAGMALQPWPKAGQSDSICPSPGYEVAFGTALQALGYSAQPVSLLPEDYRLTWQRRLGRQRVELASLAVAIFCAVALAFGTWRKAALASSKAALLAKVQAGQEAFHANEMLTGELLLEYENLRPILAAQQNTVDTLKTLTLLKQTASNRTSWFVLLADQQSYFSQPLATITTNRPARTNLLGATLEPPRALSPPLPASPAALTNSSLARPGFITELCVPGNAERSRQTLSELVNHLKQQRLFSKVDLLSDDLRRSLADSKVTVPDRDYVLALDFAEADFHQPSRVKRLPFLGPPRPPTKRGTRTGNEAAEVIDRFDPGKP